MNDDLKIRERLISLFQLYQNLLSDAQKEAFRWHYLYDLSYSEMADENHTSRAAQSDALFKASQKLEDIEAKLGFYAYRCRLLKLLENQKKNIEASIYQKLEEGIKDGF